MILVKKKVLFFFFFFFCWKIWCLYFCFPAYHHLKALCPDFQSPKVMKIKIVNYRTKYLLKKENWQHDGKLVDRSSKILLELIFLCLPAWWQKFKHLFSEQLSKVSIQIWLWLFNRIAYIMWSCNHIASMHCFSVSPQLLYYSPFFLSFWRIKIVRCT